MNDNATIERHEFQAEVRQILDLVIHSLYSHREIFLRELISNASDAVDKLRFEALGNDALYAGDSESRIDLALDEKTHTLTISDNGIGMSREEVIDNLGTIAHSGTRRFLEQLSGDAKKDNRLIGQFGVGFYSAFIVADRVEVITRRAGAEPADAVRWESDGKGGYTLESVEKASRGTQVIVHLREDAYEFAENFRVRDIVRRYSDHIAVPIHLSVTDADGKTGESEAINRASALWMRPKAEVSDDDYKALYKHIAHDFEDPLTWIHNRVEGNNEYSSLLYIPARAPFDLWDRERRHGVKLYVKRVFIMDDAEQLLPGYLRFVRGVIDSDDLPLNVSRELLQKNRVIDSIRSASVKRVLGLLESMAGDNPEQYAKFWSLFGGVLKEGPAEDHENAGRIAKLLRFASTRSEGDKADTSLDDYIARMPEGQDKIYYITAETVSAARHSPHLEAFEARGVEVLLLGDRVDEWLVAHLPEFAGKSLVSIARGEVDLDAIKSATEGQTADESDSATDPARADKAVLNRIATALGERIKQARASKRLTRSAACLVADEHDLNSNLARILKEVGQEVPAHQPILEVNLAHPLVQRMADESDTDRFGDLARVLFDQSVLAEGGTLEDPAGFVRRINELLVRAH
ncbi:MAG: molecular chaperone HtpG [Chromatiales bacterium]|nr:molecular chaperone HtpG [Chromatiales bacterium]